MKNNVIWMWGTAVVTTAYLLMLGWFNTLTADDFTFAAEVESRGIWGQMIHMYMTWQCRYTGFLISGVMYELFGQSENLIISTIFMLVICWTAFYKLFKDVFPDQSKNNILPIAIVISNLVIMALPEISTFYWMCCFGYILLNVITILLLDWIFIDKSTLTRRWIGVIICSVIISGAFELFNAIFVACLGCYLLYDSIKKKRITWLTGTKNQLIFVSICIVAFGLVVQWLGPGTQIRMAALEEVSTNFMHDFSLIAFITISLRSLINISILFLFKAHYYILIVPMFLYLGVLSRDHYKITPLEAKSLIRNAVFIFISFYLFTIFLSVFALGIAAPMRAYTFITYVIFAVVALICFWLGVANIKISSCNCYIATTCIILSLVTSYFIWSEYPIVRDYKRQVVATINYIKKEAINSDKNRIVVKPIKVTYAFELYSFTRKIKRRLFRDKNHLDIELKGFFPYYEFILSENPHDFRNDGLKRYLHINNDIIGWEKEG